MALTWVDVGAESAQARVPEMPGAMLTVTIVGGVLRVSLSRLDAHVESWMPIVDGRPDLAQAKASAKPCLENWLRGESRRALRALKAVRS